MIGFISGQVKLVDEQILVMTSSGVGYQVQVGSRWLTQLHQDEPISLYIHTHVKEDQLSLFGFKTLEEKKLFQLLLHVSGVGPSTALAVSELGSTTIVEAVQEARVSLFTSVPRVGKKLAQKIIIELKSKLGSLKELELGEVSGPTHELVEALLALGFSEQESYQTAKIYAADERAIEVVLKEAIQTIKTRPATR